MTFDAERIRDEVTGILGDMTRDWDFEYSEGICDKTRLVADLGCESIDFVMLIVSIEAAFHRKNLPFEDLLMKNGKFVGDVTVDQIVAMLEKCLA